MILRSWLNRLCFCNVRLDRLYRLSQPMTPSSSSNGGVMSLGTMEHVMCDVCCDVNKSSAAVVIWDIVSDWIWGIYKGRHCLLSILYQSTERKNGWEAILFQPDMIPWPSRFLGSFSKNWLHECYLTCCLYEFYSLHFSKLIHIQLKWIVCMGMEPFDAEFVCPSHQYLCSVTRVSVDVC